MKFEEMPELDASVAGPFRSLEKSLFAQREAMEQWFTAQWQKTPPPVYGSVDLRNAGFKLAPIDMNLFPAGFNNLNPRFLSVSAQAAQSTILRLVPQAKRILIIPESHTRNLVYWQNIDILKKILEETAFSVRIGFLDLEKAEEINLSAEKKILIEPLQRKGNQLSLAGFQPDFVLLNNDLSAGIPEILQGLAHPIFPPAELGWSQRLKSEHFRYYADVSKEFAEAMAIDPWLITPFFQQCGQIDFMQQEGIECLVADVETLLTKIQKKYDEYTIPHKPFVIVKADAGTYGMAVMTVREVSELKTMNRKQRTRMAMTKGGQPVRQVIIQEGVYTFETVKSIQAVAEPVVYLWGQCVVGGFYRVHETRGIDENLNTPGMQFIPLPFLQSCHEPANAFYLYGVVARLSMLAAAREIV